MTPAAAARMPIRLRPHAEVARDPVGFAQRGRRLGDRDHRGLLLQGADEDMAARQAAQRVERRVEV
jgi:hypothetical protein